MDKKLCIELIETRGKNVYSLHIPYGVPFGELLDVVRTFLSDIDEHISKKNEADAAENSSSAGDAQK